MNYIKMNKGVGEGNEITYPTTQEQIDNLENSNLVNPKVGNNYGLKIPDDWDQQAAADEILKVRLQTQKNMDILPVLMVLLYHF